MKDHVDMIIDQWNSAEPDADVSAMKVFTRIFRLNRHMTQPLAAIFKKYSLYDGEFDLLATLHRNNKPEGMTPNELRGSVVLSSGAMTNRLDSLERAGMIARSANPSDRRSTYVSLTDKGENIVKEALGGYLEYLDGLLGVLSEEERGAGADILRKLLMQMEGECYE
jgi:DNA-binding MarR family transcriptional regulator